MPSMLYGWIGTGRDELLMFGAPLYRLPVKGSSQLRPVVTLACPVDYQARYSGGGDRGSRRAVLISAQETYGRLRVKTPSAWSISPKHEEVGPRIRLTDSTG
jgi:hypothetical protein